MPTQGPHTLLISYQGYLGPAAGVAASLLWTFTAMLFTAAGKRLGATTVNALRLGLAVVWLGLTHHFLTGHWVPEATGRQVWLLALSGLVGLTIGDLALFSAFVSIGPRLAMLVMTTAPIFAALFGWAALGETLSGPAWLGMMLTIGGVAWVVLERSADNVEAARSRRRATGLLLAFVAAICQAAGSLLSKQGMGHGWLPEAQLMSPQAATLVRMFFAALFALPTIPWLLARYRTPSSEPHTMKRRRRRAGYLFTLCGSVVGPFLGVWMSLEAFHRASLGVAQTACSLTPVFILPFVILIQKERVTLRAALGAGLAVVGTALLFVQAR